MNQQIDSLYRWHAPDPSGEQAWKNARLSAAIADLSTAIDRQTEMLRTMTAELQEVQRVVSDPQDK